MDGNPRDSRTAGTAIGLSVVGSATVGVAGVIAAVVAGIGYADFVGTGMCLLAAAVAFGLLANAIFRQ